MTRLIIKEEEFVNYLSTEKVSGCGKSIEKIKKSLTSKQNFIPKKNLTKKNKRKITRSDGSLIAN